MELGQGRWEEAAELAINSELDLREVSRLLLFSRPQPANNNTKQIIGLYMSRVSFDKLLGSTCRLPMPN